MAFYGTKLEPRKLKKYIQISQYRSKYFVTWRKKGAVSEGLSSTQSSVAFGLLT